MSQLLACSESGSPQACDTIVADLQPKLAAAPDGSVLRVVGLTLDAKTPGQAARVARERLLSSLADLTNKFNFAHATVLGLVQVLAARGGDDRRRRGLVRLRRTPARSTSASTLRRR